jgi:hypothetical protein
MLKLIGGAAIAAVLAFAPAANINSAVAETPAQASAAPVHAAVHTAAVAEFGLAIAGNSGLAAEGQSADGFRAWIAGSGANRDNVSAFGSFLASEGVGSVIPLWELTRTSSSWRECGAEPFEAPPRDKWDHIVTTLKFVRDDVVPAVGQVEAVSGYRNAKLNACSDGAPKSAHREFFALDLTPVNAAVDRDDMIRSVCAAHARDGRAYKAGLGFYTGRRFHVDSHGFRKWGANGKGATSPCNSYA